MEGGGDRGRACERNGDTTCNNGRSGGEVKRERIALHDE